MIFSHLSFCVTSWSQAASTITKPLRMIYNRAIKILDRKPIRSHHCHVLQKLNMLSFDNFINLANLKLIHKCLHNQAPQVLSDLVVPLSALGSVTRGASSGNCKVRLCKSSFGQTAFSVRAINMWNSLPVELKLDVDLDHFKLKLKQFLKRNQSCSHV